MILVVLIAPVYIIPIFNKVTRLDDSKVTPADLKLGARQRNCGGKCL